ncbi:MAG TPA: T9SS type A sorting domain-containing protein, partial [Chitinophagaceae bacterium]
CFDLSGMTTPTLSFNLALDIEDCGAALCDAAWVEYSTDGNTWNKLGTVGSGTNWYNKNYSGFHLWSNDEYGRWHVATSALPTTNNSRLRLRFVFASDQVLNKEGMGVDDIHIYDNIYGIYTVTGTSPVVNQATVNGNNWINFIETGTNKLIASILPNNQDLGSTNVQSYIQTGPIRDNGTQYYHHRNITIKPTNNSLGATATVRFYFLDSETEALIGAVGCNSCTKPSWFGELGVSKYSDPNDAVEDGDLGNSVGTYWSFITPANVKKVPFDKGYYAEFQVQNFSEFWLNDGWVNGITPLPVELKTFTATKTANRKNVLAAWTTSTEINVNRFEVEMAKGNDGLSQDRFVKIGEVAAAGNSTTEQHYQFVDEELNKAGVRHYRLKIIDDDGKIEYSAIRPVIFSDEIRWQVFPNPSDAVFNFIYQLNAGEAMNLQLYDAMGRVVYRRKLEGNGFVQKLPVDLGASVYSKGVYLLEAVSGEKRESFRLIKN